MTRARPAEETPCPVPWLHPVAYFVGSRSRLAGIHVFHDFDWDQVVGHSRRAFLGGRRLALLVQSHCPPGKTPALLLTTDPDSKEGRIETDTDYVAVVRLDEYFASADADPATTYFASRLGTDIIAAPGSTLIEVNSGRVEEIDAYFDEHLEATALRRWLGRRQGAVELAREVLDRFGEDSSDQPPIRPEDIIASVEAINSLDSGLVAAVQDLLRRVEGSEERRALIEALTESPEGRADTATVLGGRLEDRIADAKAAAQAYHAILQNPNAIETDMQEFLQDHPWLIGLDYLRIRPKQPVPRGALDFILERYDGYHDVLELKSPQDRIIVEESPQQGALPGSPSKYSLSPTLANALAQSHDYRELLDADQMLLAERYDLERARQPGLIIVVGRETTLSPITKRILRQLNLSMHRVEIVGYDVISRRAELFLERLEDYLQGQHGMRNGS